MAECPPLATASVDTWGWCPHLGNVVHLYLDVAGGDCCGTSGDAHTRTWSHGMQHYRSSSLTKKGGPRTAVSSPAWFLGFSGSFMFSPMPCAFHTRSVDPKMAIRTGVLLTDLFTHLSWHALHVSASSLSPLANNLPFGNVFLGPDGLTRRFSLAKNNVHHCTVCPWVKFRPFPCGFYQPILLPDE